MKQDTFVAKHKSQWETYEAWLDETDVDKRRDLEAEVNCDWIPALYRQTCHHLALARERRYSAHLVDHLNQLVIRGHQRLYQVRHTGFGQVQRFLFVVFPSLVRRQARLFWLTMLLFCGPLISMWLAVNIFPETVYTVLSPQDVGNVEDMYDPGADKIGRDRDSGDDFMMFGYYIKNNVGIGFQTLAGGMLFGIGTVFYLVFNGLYIGAIAGHLTQIGYGQTFFSFVSGHSAFELTAIVICGMAGMKLAQALLIPGRRSRLRALREEGQVAVQLVYGAGLMLIAAAFLEAFWSSTTVIEVSIKYGFGVLMWTVVILYFLFSGRGHES